jgi:glycosyltransferase involved in cell wall biosynthesis
MAEQMGQFAPARGRIHHIPSFVDDSLLDGRGVTTVAPATAQEPSRPYVLYFGRVSADKGLDVLLHAAHGLDRDVDIVIAGESKDGYRQHLDELISTLGVKNVRFAGFREGAALSTLITNALCVVAPSIWHDNAPMSVYESLAHGKAVIGSDLGGISEQLEEGAGMLVPAGDADSLRQAVRTLVDQEDFRLQLQQAAYQRAMTTYAPELHYERVMAVFEALLNR